MAKKSISASDAVAKSRAKTGTKSIATAMKADEITLLDEMAEKHGGRKAAILAGLAALKGAKEPTKADLIAMIERRMK